MENLKINKKSEQTTATYTKGGYRVEITYNVDKTGGNIDSIDMSIYGDAMVTISATRTLAPTAASLSTTSAASLRASSVRCQH